MASGEGAGTLGSSASGAGAFVRPELQDPNDHTKYGFGQTLGVILQDAKANHREWLGGLKNLADLGSGKMRVDDLLGKNGVKFTPRGLVMAFNTDPSRATRDLVGEEYWGDLDTFCRARVAGYAAAMDAGIGRDCLGFILNCVLLLT